MIGFIKKDLCLIKGNIKTLVILLLVYGVMSFQEGMNLSFLLPIMSVIIMMSTFSYDAYNKWDAFAITLPNGRKNSAKAKYLTTFILMLITTTIVTIVGSIISYIQNGVFAFNNVFSIIIGSVFATTLMQAIMYPAIYKFGVEKARIGVFVGVFIITVTCGIIAKFIDLKELFSTFSFLETYGIIILPITILIMLYLSLKISEHIYLKKEF